ncbi:1292_t:CDS:1, partial [Racocetra fulgida]
ELDELKKLYESASTTFTFQETENEGNYTEIEDVSEDDEDSTALLVSNSDDDYNESDLSNSESTDNNNELLVSQEYIVKDQKAK